MENSNFPDAYRNHAEHCSGTLDERASLILEAIRFNSKRKTNETSNPANIRSMDAFLAFLKQTFPLNRFNASIQKLPKFSIRTTDRNYIVEVPGKSLEQIVLIAHYDTWAGFSKYAPGADDNKTGVEMLKHYLLRDLYSDSPPPLTHVYLFSGSEECGMGGLLAQMALIGGLYVAGYAIAAADWRYFLLSVLFLPLGFYRFGITGTKHFLKNMSQKTKALIRAAIAIDSVGEGRLYILQNEMGANFIRALVPYEGSESLNGILEEGAHLHGIKYNQFMAGGTTDSVAFLEERVFWKGHRNKPIPAAALLTMSPGKASPIVVGGKLHTQKDTHEHVHLQPLKETLTVLDYAQRILHGEQRPTKPRWLPEHHYARLYRDHSDLYVALKDAVEPNQRNINTVYKAKGVIENKTATVQIEGVPWWGVETTLKKEMKYFNPEAKEIKVNHLTVEGEEDCVVFIKPNYLGRKILAGASGVLGATERLIGRYSFASMFVLCYLVAKLFYGVLDLTLVLTPGITHFVLDHLLGVFIVIWLSQILLLFRLFTRELPAAMDNAYKHCSRADNYSSLRRSQRTNTCN